MTRVMRWAMMAVATASALRSAAAQQPAAKAPLADNSFLMEEAYNQEKGVVQHISVFQKVRGGDDWFYAFTQEWPVGGQRHQFSYTIPVTNLGPRTSGIGDVLVNWRYQLRGADEDATWISPRLSLVLPTGDDKKGLGTGVAGVQADLPISHRWTPNFVSHTNLGVTVLPNAKDAAGRKGTSTAYNLGQSFVFEPTYRTNFIVETVWTGTSRTIGSVDTWDSTLYISPGIRWGFDFESGLQVVPGIAFPIGLGASKGADQVLLYLSFEHPFGTQR